MKAFRKGWEIKAEGAALSGNSISGAAAVIGNLDSYADVIFPGAFEESLPGFLSSGFVAQGHEWDELPIAMPKIAEMRGRQLYTEAEFHSHSDAQDARTVAMERLNAGLSVGLSVGFFCDWREGMAEFESGKKLLEFALNNGYDLSLFDVAALSAHESWCQAILKIKRLIEYSIVAIPANPQALAMSAKSLTLKSYDFDTITTVRALEDFLRDAGATKAQALTLVSRLKDSLRDAGGQHEPPTNPAATTPAEPTPFATLAYRALELRSAVAGVTTQ